MANTGTRGTWCGTYNYVDSLNNKLYLHDTLSDIVDRFPSQRVKIIGHLAQIDQLCSQLAYLNAIKQQQRYERIAVDPTIILNH